MSDLPRECSAAAVDSGHSSFLAPRFAPQRRYRSRLQEEVRAGRHNLLFALRGRLPTLSSEPGRTTAVLSGVQHRWSSAASVSRLCSCCRGRPGYHTNAYKSGPYLCVTAPAETRYFVALPSALDLLIISHLPRPSCSRIQTKKAGSPESHWRQDRVGVSQIEPLE